MLSERYRQPLGLLLVGVVLFGVGFSGDDNALTATSGDQFLQFIEAIGRVFMLLAAVWIVMLLVRRKRD